MSHPSPDREQATDRSEQPPERITLGEHETSDPVALSDPALDALAELNADIQGSRIGVEHGRDDTVQLSAGAYVGTVSLPDGPDVRITPKAAGTNFLALLKWAHGTTPRTHESPASAAAGRTFVDAFGWLFSTELDRLLTRGPHREYQWTDATETRVRGQLDLQRQLQHQTPATTAFELTYEELTADTVANRGIRQAAERLTTVVRDESLASQLHQQARQLAQWTSQEPVRPADLNRVETTRLNDHYETILRLAEHVLRHHYLDDFRDLDTASFGLLVNMNSVFEDAVEQTARAAVGSKPGWDVQTQERIKPIATGGTPTVDMYPDFYLERDGTPQLVGDAKWKTDTIEQKDIYQLSAYMLALEVPGVLVYPEQTEPGVSIETSYTVDGRHRLVARELPTATTPDDQSFPEQLQERLWHVVAELLPPAVT